MSSAGPNAAIAGDLRALRERETHRHSLGIGDYDGTAQQIAQRLAREDSSFEWIPDTVSVESESPFTSSEASRFLEMLRYLDASKIRSLETLSISSEDIPFPEEFGEFVHREESARALSASLSNLRTHHAYQRIRSMGQAEQLQVEQRILELRSSFADLRNHSPQTVARLFDALNAGEYRALRQLKADTLDTLEQLAGSASIAQASVVGTEGIDRGTLLRDATARLAHLRSGGEKGTCLVAQK